MKRRIVIPFVVLVVSAGLWWFLAGRGPGGDGAPRLYGNVDIREVELAPRVPGLLAEVRVDEGDAVDPGDVLAVLDGEPYSNALARAEAERDAARANLDKLLAGYRSEEVAQARARVAQVQARAENAERVARRRQELYQGGVIAAQDYEDAVAARDAAAAELDAARKALRLQVTGFRSEDVQAAEAGLRAAEAAAAAARTDLADTLLVAPAGGTVLSRVREPGAMIGAGTTVLVLSLDRPVWVRAYVPEPLLGRVHPGMAVEVTTDSRPDEPYAGRVGFISPVAEFTPKSVETEALRTDLVYRLRIVVDEADQGLRQGMPVTVTLPRDDRPSRP
ncbi:secretion protein HlyD [Desulfocurvus sp.]|uniref:secretion protein HlyD n=1 Tax=Desulfocurvus sp. TaxID=2871698 RepID=UPI0025C0F609|nr:secretion protein HlyD [Desulfocurvus sp.]MCK9241055.1 secretion protein HlyD [Desulfocurvus sp.]